MSTESATLRRILVIDDNPSIHEDFGKILKSDAASNDECASLEAALFGDSTPVNEKAVNPLTFDLEFALQGQDGYELVKEAVDAGRPFSMAFVDMRMPPGWCGVETIENLWKVQPELQIVICTAYADYSWDEISARLGQTDQLLLLKKPFDTAEVWQMAGALSEKWNLALQGQRQMVELQETNEELRKEVELRRQMESQLRHDALHDPLTDLPNRAMLMERLERCIVRTQRRDDALFALLFMDVDNFKMVNDSWGHTAGDILLVKVAARLAEGLRELDTVSRTSESAAIRLGGDEFVVLLEEIKRESDAVTVGERLSQLLAEPFEIDGRTVDISVSVGVVIGGLNDDDCPQDILRDADTAMYRAKMSGKSQLAVFKKNMHEAVKARLLLDGDLHRAVEDGQFQLNFQPIVILESGKICGFEALLRWHHPKRGLIAPMEFIPIAEENGLIIPIGQWVLNESCRQLAKWNRTRSADEDLSISVNISRRQLSCPDFLDSVKQAISTHDLRSAQLQLEITESLIMEDPDAIRDKLWALHELGVGLHMDDFGTGHSSLACLHRFPFDVLKIDRSFADNMRDSRDYAAVVLAITTLAHNLDVKVVAEGIERSEQIAQLLSLDCDFGQGFLFAKPLDADGADALLDSDDDWLKVA